MRRFILLYTFIILSVCAYCQTVEENKEIRDALDHMFEKLDKSKVPHGLLRDFAFEMVELDYYNGKELSDSNYVDRLAYENILRTMRSASFRDLNFTAEQVLNDQDLAGTTDKCAIGIALYQYSYIKADALTNNLITYTNEQVADRYIGNTWQNPYETGYVFGFAPQDTVFSSNLSICFPANIWKSNVSLSKIEFDADDGRGYETIEKGSTLIKHLSGGIHHLKMRATLTNGTILLSHTLIKTISNNPPTRGDHEATEKIPISGSYNGTLAQGRISCLYKKKAGTPLKPFIIMEGFDPIWLAGNNEIIDAGDAVSGTTYLRKFLNRAEKLAPSFYNKLINEYDIFYIDMYNSEEYIQANAKMLEEAIQIINQKKKDNHSSEKNTILAQSMGGLVARYALTDMERNRIKHETSLLMCQDSPFLGANVPLGALHAIYATIDFFDARDLLAQLPAVKTSMNKAKRLLGAKSTQQMLYNNVELKHGNLDNSMHTAWQNELSNIGYPSGDEDYAIRLVGISNGSQKVTDPNSPLIHMEGKITPASLSDIAGYLFFETFSGAAIAGIAKDWQSIVMGILPGRNTLYLKADVNPCGSGKNICDIQIKYIKKFLWLIKITHTFYSYVKSMPNNMVPYDIMPGSYYEIPGDLDFNGIVDFSMVDRIMFIPTVSALDIGRGKTALTRADYEKVYDMTFLPKAPKDTPFDAFYICEDATNHISINSDMGKFMLTQMSVGLEGPAIVTTGSRFFVRNNTFNSPVTWESTDPSLVEIDQDGIITTHGHGFVTIIARCIINGEEIKLGREVMSEIPPHKILYSLQHNQHQIMYVTNPPLPYKFQQYLRYQYGVKYYPNVPVEWKDYKHGEYLLIPTSNTAKNFTIFFRALSNEITGDTQFMNIEMADPYVIDPMYFRDRTNSTILIKPNPNFKGSYDNLKIYMLVNKSSGMIVQYPNDGVTSLSFRAKDVFTPSQLNQSGTITGSMMIMTVDGKVIQEFTIESFR